ncbi:Fic family protein [Candidatus Palauibacter sp.]|uniref:Fic family protein n=1 Tax=Candidatus Palauibacter sp. TaxID=3101350 RepID=UPI003B013A6D
MLMSERYPHLQFRQHWEISATAQRQLGECDGLVSAISGTPIRPEHHERLLKVALVKGAMATTAIEGNTLTAEEVERVMAGARFPRSREYQATEVRNVLDAMNSLLNEVVEGQGDPPVTRRSLLRMHRMIGRNLGEHFDAIPGRFRTDPRTVGLYRCPEHEDVEDLVDRLCAWLRDGFPGAGEESTLASALIQAIVAHVYLEWIHPFGDGNGRTGRLLEFYILLRAGHPDIASHVLSNFYNLTRPEYYRQLHLATQARSLTAFLDYAIEGFRDGLRETLATVQQSQLETAWRSFVHERFGRLTHRKTSVLKRRRNLMLAIPLEGSFTTEEIALLDPRTARVYGALSARTLRRDLAVLIETNLLAQSDSRFFANVETLSARMARRAGATDGRDKSSHQRADRSGTEPTLTWSSAPGLFRRAEEPTHVERETARSLHRLDPQLAGLYELGLGLAWETDRPGRASALAYVGRELSRGVIGRLSDGRDSPEPDRSVQSSLKKDDTGDHNRTRIAAVLGLPREDARVRAWSQLPAEFAGWEKYRPGGPPPDEVERAYGRLSSLLFGQLASYYETEAELDDLLAVQSPTVAHARRLQPLLLRAGQRNYFFQRLRDPRWVKPLYREGFFRDPPDSRTHAILWPEGQYLASVASEAPSDVAIVLADIPTDNRNPIVWALVAMAGSRLPPEMAIRTVPALSRALQRIEPWYLTKDIVDLSVHLAVNGRREAFELTRHLLFVESPEAVEDLEEARNRVDTKWVFPRFVGEDERGLIDRLIPALEKLDATETLSMLLDKTRRIQALSTAMNERYRCLWNVAHYDLSPNATAADWDDIVGLLFEHAVGVARRLALSGPGAAQQVIATLDAQRELLALEADHRFFVRFSYGVLAAAGQHLPRRIDEIVGSPEALRPGLPATEFAALLRCQFRTASLETREAYAAALEAGAARDEVRDGLRAFLGSMPTEDDVTDEIRRQQRRVLTFFRGDFPDELQPLAAKLGLLGTTPSHEDQRLAEVGSYVSTGFGHPFAEGEIPAYKSLAMLSVDEVVEYANKLDWGGNEAVAFEAGSSFATYAGRHPGRAIQVLARSVEDGLSPEVSGRLLAGLGDAARGGRTFDWPLALNAIESFLQRAAALDLAATERLQEWREAVGYAARLIGEGCATDAVSAELAESVWRLLDNAATVPVVWRQPYSTEETDLAAVLRAAEGDATGDVSAAVLEAAMWEYHCVVSQMQGAPSDEIKSSARRTVGKRLTKFLDAWLVDEGPNRAVPLVVVGGSLPNLHFLIPEWTTAHAETLFRGGVEHPAESPAWTGYVWRARFHPSVFEALRTWYVEAVEKAEDWSVAVRECEFFHRDLPAILAEHLLIATQAGLLSPADSDGLLAAAYANLPPDSWDGAYRARYRSWKHSKSEMPTEVVQRLVDVWRWRVSELQCRPTSSTTIEEAKTLAWFLRLPHMANDDLLELGPETARLAGGRFSLSGQWDRLERLAEADPDRAFLIVEAVFTAQLSEEYPYFPDKEARPLFRRAVDSANSETRDRARHLIDQLGERGYRDLRDLVTLDRNA